MTRLVRLPPENTPQPSRYLDGTYLRRNPTWHSEDSPQKAAWIHAMLARNGVSPRSVADVGCGAGGVLAELQKLAPAVRYHGFDISPDALALARTTATPGLSFHQEDITVTQRGGFDCLLAIDVFEHVPDYLAFLARIRPLAEHKVFHIPLDISVQAVLRGSFGSTREEVGHLHYFSAETAIATLHECGYQILSREYTRAAIDCPAKALRTRLTNIGRRAAELFGTGFAARLLGGYSLLVLAR